MCLLVSSKAAPPLFSSFHTKHFSQKKLIYSYEASSHGISNAIPTAATTNITCYDNRRLMESFKTLPLDQLITYLDRADGTIVWLHVSLYPLPRRQLLTKYI